MEDIHKYIGIPFKFARYDFNGCDCIGLIRLWFQDHQWKPEIYDGKPFSRTWYKREPYRMIRWFMRHFNLIRNINDLKFGDIVYFHINGEGHCGIYLNYGKLLTTFPHCQQWDNSNLPDQSMIIHRFVWGKIFRAGFRRKDTDLI